MNRKALIDTNILLDAVMPERPDWEYATILLDEIQYGNLSGYLTATSLKDVYYIVTRYTDEPTARELVKALLKVFALVEVGEALSRVAAYSDEPDFENGIVRACAEQAGVDFIISRDEKAFARSTIRRLSAREYVEAFCPADDVEL